ncbi:hypothetical protein SAMN05421882_103725 [Nitrosomonas communis]|uniref:Uncharacterized protein n=1 Tax=Nitrosomonas communis TaxID=44574 RepID=A0A1H2XFD6_9PROT|nr:hypothetical protein SAMN05421882_103725 [Nitrosomonas communis]
MRRPILTKDDLYIISPELLLDSLFTNTHYSLIESRNAKDTYLEVQSERFLDKIADVGRMHGYAEIDRERRLFKKKNYR